ncbi:MAG: histidine--tRNA ligase, partial [Chitinophagaceae bacterium]
KNTADLTERALKYDLTIPFARYVAMNHGQLSFPYKRYQVQPVWRADRPQKGRYREFTQCDADVVGSTALLNEVELCNIYHTAFTNMGLRDYELKINSRKMLVALAEMCGGADKMIDITIAIDKLDKIGLEKVKEELAQRGLAENQIAVIENYLNLTGSNEEKITAARALFSQNETAAKGIEELIYVSQQAGNTNISIDFTLARGLNYYTGIIFEVKAPASVKMGSIGGGGRYDDLTGLFGVPNIPGVGISFGVDRIYDVLEELQLFPATLQSSTKALFFNMGENEALLAFTKMQELRSAGIPCEMYHEPAKMDKQFKYADKKFIPFIIILGSKEIENKEAVVKNLSTGQQQNIPFTDLIAFFQ